MRDLLTRGMWLASVMASLSTCADSQHCAPWAEVECTCEDGEVGTRLCLSNGDLDECYCAGDRSWHDGLDAGGDDSRSVADLEEDASFDARPIDGHLLVAGAEKLLDVFVRDEDVWVILENRVIRIALADGAELASWHAPRQISATAFDGERLATLDGAKLTMLEPAQLAPQRSLDLVEPCESAALMSAGPLACTVGNKLYVVDPASGARQSLSRGIYTGVLREVPGTRRFLTIDVSHTGSARIFELGADGRLTGWPALNPSAFRASEELSGPAAFDGFPSQNLVTKSGLLLRIDGTCGPSAESCLLPTGSLELLAPGLRFVAMDTADNQLFGLLDRAPDPFSDHPRCYANPCRLMRIDARARQLLAEQTVARPLGSVVALRALPKQGAVVLGITTSLVGTFPPSIPGGFEVVRLDLPHQ